MKPTTFLCFVGFFTATLTAIALATVGGQYSVNVHFVPPLVTAPCQVAQFWTPTNVTCALCFCMTGSLSRCIPQPGCNPQNQNSTRPTNETMPAQGTPDQSSMFQNHTESMSGTGAGAAAPPPDAMAPAAGMPPAMGGEAAPPPAEGAPADAAEPPAGREGAVQGSKTRAAKPGKSRRRRRSST